jgi:predicted thioesterase
MIALMENAAFAATAPVLTQAQTTVGIRVNIKHLAATPVGLQVRARAELTRVDERRLFFNVEAWDEVEKIGEGTHERYIVDSARFAERTSTKQKLGQEFNE